MATRKIKVQSPAGRKTLTGDAQENLLFACYRHGLEIDYSCRSGGCLQCMVKVSGEGLQPPGPRETFRLKNRIEQGYRLACQAFFTGDANDD